jgi:hypothetical protein
LDKAKLGRIIFANLLSRSFRSYRAFIKTTESLEGFQRLISKGLIQIQSNKQLSPKKRENLSNAGCLGQFVGVRGEVQFQYLDLLSARRYLLSKVSLSDLSAIERQAFCRVRRIMSRNQLTEHILKVIARHQSPYLLSENSGNLQPLSQKLCATELKVHPSWVSRVIQDLIVALPNGTILPLKHLFPSSCVRIKWALRQCLNNESRGVMKGSLPSPYSDRAIQQILKNHYSIETSQRNISSIRRALGIPSVRSRSQDFWYPLASPFSGVYAFSFFEVELQVPQGYGVYEIRLSKGHVSYPKISSSILYLGCSKNLKKRLKEHLRPKSRNQVIVHYLDTQACSFRFLVSAESHKKTEKKLYTLFIATFGAPPVGNRVSPPG